MSVHNLLRLVRNIRPEREGAIVYDNRVSSWPAIFKKHPLKSKIMSPIFITWPIVRNIGVDLMMIMMNQMGCLFFDLAILGLYC